MRSIDVEGPYRDLATYCREHVAAENRNRDVIDGPAHDNQAVCNPHGETRDLGWPFRFVMVFATVDLQYEHARLAIGTARGWWVAEAAEIDNGLGDAEQLTRGTFAVMELTRMQPPQGEARLVLRYRVEVRHDPFERGREGDTRLERATCTVQCRLAADEPRCDLLECATENETVPNAP